MSFRAKREISKMGFLGFLSLEMTVFFLVFLTILFGFANDASSASNTIAAGSPTECIITIKSVQLEKNSGEWITVIDPDHQVDLVNQDPTVSFFNNGRRVPAGSYSNFKILLLKTIKVKDAKRSSFIYEAHHDEIEISGSKDFIEPLVVKGRSFISVWFELDLSGTIQYSSAEAHFLAPKKVKQAIVIVDDQKITIPGENIRIVF